MTAPALIPFVSLAEQTAGLRAELEEATRRVFSRSSFILGEEVARFEAELAAFHGCAHGVGVASGTDAIHLALRACGVGPGDEVITVANVWVPTVCAIYAAGARPVLVDIDPRTHQIDVAKAAAAVGPKTRALLPVHLYGQVPDMEPLLAIARAHGLRVIEDACQAHGALYDGRAAGSFGDAGCFSFYPTKNLGGFGDGGMVLVQDAEIAERLRMLRNYGETRERYTSACVGTNSRLDEVQAAVLRVKLRHLAQWNQARRAHARQYDALLAGAGVRCPSIAGGATPNYHLYVVRSPRREALRAWLRDQGILTGVHYPVPVHLQPAYAHLGYHPGDLAETERACEEVLSLPIYPELAPDAIARVADAIRRFDAERGAA
jgi:dTDP-4-amino-4,6-dideoxygalactose transaminase